VRSREDNPPVTNAQTIVSLSTVQFFDVAVPCNRESLRCFKNAFLVLRIQALEV